uniref:Putative ovule protein n=1 Tax=Solanum chacoense TaxID=4108 RepID=A0A0V0HX60_SOLCH
MTVSWNAYEEEEEPLFQLNFQNSLFFCLSDTSRLKSPFFLATFAEEARLSVPHLLQDINAKKKKKKKNPYLFFENRNISLYIHRYTTSTLKKYYNLHLFIQL